MRHLFLRDDELLALELLDEYLRDFSQQEDGIKRAPCSRAYSEPAAYTAVCGRE